MLITKANFSTQRRKIQAIKIQFVYTLNSNNCRCWCTFLDRFSYILNRPLNLSDASGHDPRSSCERNSGSACDGLVQPDLGHTDRMRQPGPVSVTQLPKDMSITIAGLEYTMQ